MEYWLADFLLASLRAATPLIFAALAIVFAERAGVLFIGVEGAMLAGALASIVGVVFLGNAWMGVLLTILIGAVLGLLLGGITIRLPANQVATGIAFNLVSLGVTSFIFRLLAEHVHGLVPAVPPLFLGISPFSVAAIILTAGSWYFLFRTGPGLKLRSMGEKAHAAHAAGINVMDARLIVLMVAGMLSALGGAALTLGWLRTFGINITLGRGFIALAAAYCGKWNPALAVIAALVFGAGEALAFRAQMAGWGINLYYFFMLPYVLTLLVIALSSKARGPAEAGKPYIRR